ncbi:MAG: thiamine ABC transporter substrate-binding protein, partial [Nocardioides sp.]
LSQSNPTGDVAFGVDNTFASRALEAGVFAPYAGDLPAGAARYRLAGDDRILAPVDQANVCVNVDIAWFAKRKLVPPATLADLVKPAYRNLLVVPGAATSSPGMAFLLSTIAEYGEQWPAYWRRLMSNGAKLTASWSDAYYVDFSQGGENGTRPVVVSYDSSPAFTVPEGGNSSTTRALLATCYQQVEYAGVLAGADNPAGAGQLIDFLLSAEVQAALPENMYVFPVRAGVGLPTAWSRFAKQPSTPYAVDPAEIASRRDEWLREWTEVTTR